MAFAESLLSPSPVQSKLAALRSLLALHTLDAYLVPSADEHLNEYLPTIKQRRQWLTGFTGSAGEFLLGGDRAWLFVDSRYYEQADLEVDAALMQVCKLELEGHLTLDSCLKELGQTARQAGQSFRLGFDPFTITLSRLRSFQAELEPCGLTLIPVTPNLVDQVRSQPEWADEELPAYADSPLFSVSDAIAGESAASKLKRVREKLQLAGADILPVTKLDQVAWLFNLRGWDVPYNPVFIAYAIVTLDQAFLFTTVNRIEDEVQAKLTPEVTLQDYEAYADTLQSLLGGDRRVLLDPHHSTAGTHHLLLDTAGQPQAKVLETSNPIEAMKARKNATEIAQMQQANLKASRAKIRTIKWVQDQVKAGKSVTEAEVAATIEGFYAAEEGFQGLSFNTIAGSGANSSIVHYGTPNPEAMVRLGDLLLLDSGAQFTGGTTDDTRTIVIGEPTPSQITRYTAVLKAHINCAMQQFPKGTTGAQLDGITRSTLWFANLDYGHGTGHGVGAFLNVHEGPNGISKRAHKPLESGMVNSIEPGYYEPGWGGIRIENLYVVRELPSEGDRPSQLVWYGFESLTHIPFDRTLIDLAQLDARQRDWLVAYYQAILTHVLPTLSPEDADWLQQACTL